MADPHFGKAAAFRFAGLFVPPGTTAAALSRLSKLLVNTNAERIVFLGDFLHAAEGRSAQMFGAVAAWRRSHAAIGMTLVRGNHDRRAGDPPTDLGFEVVDGPSVEGPFALAHHPAAVEGLYVLAGHIHPCVTVRGRGRGNSERLACFWFGAQVGVLPAFGEFTGCAEIAADVRRSSLGGGGVRGDRNGVRFGSVRQGHPRGKELHVASGIWWAPSRHTVATSCIRLRARQRCRSEEPTAPPLPPVAGRLLRSRPESRVRGAGTGPAVPLPPVPR